MTQSLLAGIATCSVCGGGLVVEHSNNKKGKYSYYICHRHRASRACTNMLRMPVADMNEAVLHAIEEHALTPEAIESVLLHTERHDQTDQHRILNIERADLVKRIARLVLAVETEGDISALAVKLRELESRRTAIDKQMASLHPVPRLAPDVIENRLAEWRRLLRQSTTTGRTVLQRVLRGRLTFTPHVNEMIDLDGNTVSGIDGYTFEGPTRFDKLFTGIAVERPKSLDPSDRYGLEGIGPEDVGDGDYGRLLEAAMSQGSCARQDSDLRPPA